MTTLNLTKTEQPSTPWQTLLWREWRNAEDKGYAGHIFNLLASEPIGSQNRFIIAALGAIFGAMVGILLDALLFSATSILVWPGLVAGGGGVYILNRHLSMRRWLAMLTPNNLFSNTKWPFKVVIVLSLLPLAFLLPSVWARGLFLGLTSGLLLGLTLGLLSWPFLGILSLFFFQGQMLETADLFLGGAAVGVGLGLGALIGARPKHQQIYSFRQVCFWWLPPPLLAEVDAALQQAIETKTAHSKLWLPVLPRLKVENLPSRTPQATVKQLNALNWVTRLIARRTLLHLSSEAFTLLLKEAQDASSPLQQTAIALLHSIERETQSWSRPICMRCLLRCRDFQIPLSLEENIIYQGCRDCRQSQDIANGELVAILDIDDRAKIKFKENKEQIEVNWLQQRTLFDFDRVEIIKANDEDVERFAVQVGNDTDTFRRSRHDHLPCKISPECNLSPNTLRILDRTFGSVEHYQE